jgi:hypothetical protein
MAETPRTTNRHEIVTVLSIDRIPTLCGAAASLFDESGRSSKGVVLDFEAAVPGRLDYSFSQNGAWQIRLVVQYSAVDGKTTIVTELSDLRWAGPRVNERLGKMEILSSQLEFTGHLMRLIRAEDATSKIDIGMAQPTVPWRRGRKH